MTTKRLSPKSEMRSRYDFGDAKPNPYAKRYAKGTNAILLDPDVAEHFKDAEAVNKALRSLIEAAKAIKPARRPAKKAS